MKQINFTLVLIFIVLIQGCNKFQPEKIKDYPISPVHKRNISVHDALWGESIQTVQHITIPYGSSKCEEKGCFDNFLIAGGKMEGPVKGKMPFDDTDPNKITLA